VYGVKKFHQLIYGRQFTLVTDHKPLTAILSPSKSLPTLAAARMQRWALLLATYQYNIEFRSTHEHSNADGLSRLPLAAKEGESVSTTTEKTLEVLRNLFAAYGLPEQLVSDNGPQFMSSEFEVCMKANSIKHIRTAPYHPASNGEAERFVQTFKRAMRAAEKDAGTLNHKLARFLLTYRTTPHATVGLSPAELFMKRVLRTRLDLLKPSLQSRVRAKQADQKNRHDAHSRDRSFDIGQSAC